MGRQRRGILGCTNLPTLTRKCEARTDAQHLPLQPPIYTETRNSATQDAKTAGRADASTSDNAGMDKRLRLPARQPKHIRRENFKLPLISSSISGGTSIQGGQCRTSLPPEAQLSEHEMAKQVLAAVIDSHETTFKSYKNEHWYISPIGFGSKKSVLLAAFKSRDPGGSGFITCKQLLDGLQAPNFGLEERQARALLVEFDVQLQKADAKVPYRSFVKHLRLPEELSNQLGQDPTLFYQESYISKVRAHAAQLTEKIAAARMSPSRSNSIGAADGSSRESIDIVLSSPASNGPSQDAAVTQKNDVDRLSFEFDKIRKQGRAEAKSRVLLAHINRIKAFSQHQQTLIEEHETMRLAVKAFHRHAHFEQAFEEENRRLRIAQRQPKGMLGSPIAKMQHNVSKDSMFFVEPG